MFVWELPYEMKEDWEKPELLTIFAGSTEK